jgi:hypothetical protein
VEYDREAGLWAGVLDGEIAVGHPHGARTSHGRLFAISAPHKG